MAVEPDVKLSGLRAASVNSGEAEAANVNVDVALCLTPPEVPMIVTLKILAMLELQETVASPELFGIVAGSMAVHERPTGRGSSDRVTVPMKPLMGLTTMVDVAGVVPSAGTILGCVAPSVKSGIGIELNVQGFVAFDSALCGNIIG